MKPNTYMRGPRSVYHPDTPLIEAAKFLAGAARRFAQKKANVGDVEVAITEWKSALAAVPKRERGE